MRDIDYSLETATSGQPLSGESFAHMRDGINETTAAIVKGLMSGAYSANDVVIIYGCVDSGTPSVDYNISAGFVLYNGEIYEVPATGVLTISGNVAVATIATTYNAIDPVTFTDLVTHSVHRIKKVSIALAASGSGIKDFSAFKTIQHSTANPVFAKLATVGSGAASTSFTLTGWDASPIDADGYFNITNGRFTPKIGYWKLSCCLTVTPSTTPAGTFDINIYKNGVLHDLVTGDTLLGTNAQRSIQFNNYIINKTVATDYYTIVMTTVSGTYVYSSVQFTAEACNNIMV